MKTKLKSLFAVALCAAGLTASALPPSPYRDIWSSTPDPQAIKDPTDVIDWGMSSRTFESFDAKHGKFLEASADAMIAAYTARIEKDPTDCEALICRAFAYLKKVGENEAFDRLAQEFGYTFDNDTMHFTGELIQKKGVTPEMNDVSAEVCDILLPLMKKAYDDLSAVPDRWKGNMAITPDIYPVDESVYFDWADVLCAKMGLAEMMCVLNMVKGFDVTMDSDLLEYTFNSRSPENGKRGVQPILENNPDFFSKVRDQKAATEAGDWWASAATLLDQWDKAHAKRSDGKQHFFDWNFEKMDDNTVQCYDWLHKHRDGLINLPYWASPFDYTLMNGDTVQFWTLQPLFAGKFLREHFPEFGVGVKDPWCNEPLLDTLPDSTLCGIYPGVSRTYIGNLMTEVARAGDFTTLPPYTPDSASTVHAIWYTNMFELGFANTGNQSIFAWERQSPLVLLDPEFNVRGVTAVFTGWSFSGYPNGTKSEWEGSAIPTPYTKESPMYKRRNVVATANFSIPKVTYLDFDGTSGMLVERTDECELVKADTTTFEAGKTYAVPVDVTIPNRITVSGTPASPAKLVLCDGATLWATNGVEVADGKALVICGQALGAGMLEATGSDGAAGIGGGGIVTINGGTVMAAGGSSGAGIGGGTVTVNGGTVTAAGRDGAAGIAGTVKFADGTAYGVSAGADEANALYKTAAAYAADPSAAYVALPYFSLKIPEAGEHYTYEVSSIGAQPKAALANQTNTYAIAAGATARVNFTPDRGYKWADDSFENPMIIANLSGDTAVDATYLPTVAKAPEGYWNNPWEIGAPVAADVVAYTNWVDGKLTLFVEGKGEMKDFTAPSLPPWDGFGGSIQSVEVGWGVTKIGKNAFGNLANLSDVVLPEGLLDIGENAFCGASDALTEVTIPSTVTNIGESAFYNCKQLQSLTIPGAVRTIGKEAFFACDALTSVTMESPVPPAAGKDLFAGHNPDLKIYVPNGSGAAYRAAPGWSDYVDSIIEPGSPEHPWEIGSPNAADVIAYMDITGKLVIEGEGDMKDFRLKGDPAPWGRAITEVEIREGVTSVGAKAFAKCGLLSDVVVKATPPPALGADALAGTAGDLKIAVPLGTSAAYKAAPGWSDYANRIVEQGSPKYPWTVGKTADDSVTAYVDDTGKLVIGGKGAMKAFDGKTDPTPWGTGITKVEIGEDVTSIGADAFNGSTALTDVTLKTTRPPVVGMNAFKGCDALETIAVPLWSSGAYKHADTWSDYADGIVEPEQPKIWADGYRIAADKQVGVCSWTWHGSISNVLEQMEADGRYNGMQLALAPWLGIDSASLYFGDQEGPEVWEFIKARVADGSLNVMSTMINFPKEDYTTLTSITNTQGYMYGVATNASDEAEQWATNLYFTAEAARLSQELGVDTLSTEAGFIYINESLMFERMKEVCLTCAVHGVQILIESGPQNSLQLTNLLVNLEAEGFTNVGINFDPGDTELFGSENPVDSFKIMKPWIRMVHVKDCKENDRTQRGWNEDCVWGDGVVSQMDFHDNKDEPSHFLEQLTAEGYAGDILYERLSGDETLTPARKEEITLAMDRIFAALPEPIAAESDEFTVDLRTRVEFEEGKTRIDVVTWSATAWGAVPGSKYTDLGFTNLTTGATGVIAEGLVGENWDDCPLPEKDGEYLLTHSTGDLKSFVTFVVSGYPIGGETNPWTVGPEDDPDGVVAWTDGNGNVYFKPPRGTVSRTGLETITNAMGGATFPAWLVSVDRSATNDLVMVIGASGAKYDSLEEALEAGEDSYTLYDVKGCIVNYNGNGAEGEMPSETFLPNVPTNLAANAFTAPGYAFEGWTTNGAGGRIVFADRAAIADPQPGVIYDLKAVWTAVPTTVGSYDDLKKVLDQAAKVGKPVEIVLDGTITPPAGEALVLPTTVDVKFSGDGKIGGLVFKEGVDWFADSIAEHSDVFAYVDEALTNVAGLVICNGLPEENRPIDLVALTNAMEQSGYEPAVKPLNALAVAGDEAAAMPANWIDQNGDEYADLAAAIANGSTAVTPDFGSEEDPVPPQVIAEESEGSDGRIYTAIVKNETPDVFVEEPLAVIGAIDGLAAFATEVSADVKFLIAPKPVDKTPGSDCDKMIQAITEGNYEPAHVSVATFTPSAAGATVTTPGTQLLAIPLNVKTKGRTNFRVARIHDGVAEAFTEIFDEVDRRDGTFIVGDGVITAFSSKFSFYAVTSSDATQVALPKETKAAYAVTNLTTGAEILPSGTTADGRPVYDLPIGLAVSITVKPLGGRTVTGENPLVIDPVTGDAAAMQALIDRSLPEADYNDGLVYDLTITVKTTKGKSGKAGKTDYNYYGKGTNGWWYADAAFAEGGAWNWILSANKGADAKKHGPYTIRQKDVDALTRDRQVELAEILQPYTDLDPSDNGGAWCLRIKWLLPAQCYRVSASKSLKAYAISGTCCSEGPDWTFYAFAKSSWALNNLYQLLEQGVDAKTCYGTFDFSFLYRIGGAREKATKVEGFARAEFKENYGVLAGARLAMAGQGSFDKKNGYAKNVSGNVAGRLGASTCPSNCCESDYAFAYDCTGDAIVDDSMSMDEINAALKEIPTAAYGSWSIKYNSSATKRLAKAIEAHKK